MANVLQMLTAKTNRRERTMDVLSRLDETRSAINVLEHPFYRRWSAGELSAEELVIYAGEYRHAVGALADASVRAAECAAADSATAEHAEGLRRHAAEETAHVALWEQFERALASEPPHADEPELEQTRTCAGAWSAGDDLLEHLAVLYAIEAGQPAIAATKLTGLSAHYGLGEEGPATEYFRVHRLLDVEHAQAARELIAQLIGESEDPEGQADRMLARATDALRGNWLLLDGVEGSFAPPALQEA
jgi:pyrroloquinoline-quinone synthase